MTRRDWPPRKMLLRLTRRCDAVWEADPEFRDFVIRALSLHWDEDTIVVKWKDTVLARRARPGGGLGDWAKDWVDCRACKLCRYRRQVVLGRGRIPADVLIIGEAPGPVEDKVGEPFRGPAGQLLDRALRELDSRGVSWYITNLVGCFPPDMRVPKGGEVEACADRLDATVRDVQPSIVVTLGREACFHLFTVGLAANRGRLMTWDRHNLPAVPSWHPAGILRSADPGRMRELRSDLAFAADEVRKLIPF